jgi:hypothetical protein
VQHLMSGVAATTGVALGSRGALPLQHPWSTDAPRWKPWQSPLVANGDRWRVRERTSSTAPERSPALLPLRALMVDNARCRNIR